MERDVKLRQQQQRKIKPSRKEDAMGKFLSGVMVGLIGGLLLTMIIPVSQDSPNQYELLKTRNLPIQEAGFRKIMVTEGDQETFYESLVEALDKDTQVKWEKITSDPVWDKLADEDKKNIWNAFEKTYVSTKEAQDTKVRGE